ncbi:unnamed protein product, partial [Phaeothamnion confervicola]
RWRVRSWKQASDDSGPVHHGLHGAPYGRGDGGGLPIEWCPEDFRIVATQPNLQKAAHSVPKAEEVLEYLMTHPDVTADLLSHLYSRIKSLALLVLLYLFMVENGLAL